MRRLVGKQSIISAWFSEFVMVRGVSDGGQCREFWIAYCGRSGLVSVALEWVYTEPTTAVARGGCVGGYADDSRVHIPLLQLAGTVR